MLVAGLLLMPLTFKMTHGIFRFSIYLMENDEIIRAEYFLLTMNHCPHSKILLNHLIGKIILIIKKIIKTLVIYFQIFGAKNIAVLVLKNF